MTTTNRKRRQARARRRANASRTSRPPADGRSWNDAAPTPGVDQLRAIICTLADERPEASITPVLAPIVPPHGRDAAAAAMHELLREAVRPLWGRGYGPADLLHAVRRQTSDLHVGLVAAAAHDSPDSPCDGEAAFLGDRAIAVGWATLDAAFELLKLLRRLPDLPPTTPPPTTSAGDRPAGRPGRIDADVLRRVRALLAKAESTTFEAEAHALTAKAQQLMARHAIDKAILDANAAVGDNHRVHTRRILLHPPYLRAKAHLVHVVARANRCEAVVDPRLGMTTVFGVEADLAATDLLVTSLMLQAASALAKIGPQRDADGRSRTKSFRNAFLLGFAGRIHERLQAAAREVATAAGDPGTVLPVLASREAAVRAAVDTAVPRTRRLTASSSNSRGRSHGRASADRAVLGGPSLEG